MSCCSSSSSHSLTYKDMTILPNAPTPQAVRRNQISRPWLVFPKYASSGTPWSSPYCTPRSGSPGTTFLERPIALPRQNDNAQAPSPDRDDHICVAQPNQTLKLFLRTIIERPHLARNTKRVVLGSWSRSTSYNDSLYQDAVEASKPGPNLRSTYFKALRKLAVLRRSRNGADFFSWLDFVSHVLDGYEGSELIL